MIGNPKDLKGYKALHDFKDKTGKIQVKKDKLIKKDQYELLYLEEQEFFTPEYKKK